MEFGPDSITQDGSGPEFRLRRRRSAPAPNGPGAEGQSWSLRVGAQRQAGGARHGPSSPPCGRASSPARGPTWASGSRGAAQPGAAGTGGRPGPGRAGPGWGQARGGDGGRLWLYPAPGVELRAEGIRPHGAAGSHGSLQEHRHFRGHRHDRRGHPGASPAGGVPGDGAGAGPGAAAPRAPASAGRGGRRAEPAGRGQGDSGAGRRHHHSGHPQRPEPHHHDVRGHQEHSGGHEGPRDTEGGRVPVGFPDVGPEEGAPQAPASDGGSHPHAPDSAGVGAGLRLRHAAPHCRRPAADRGLRGDGEHVRRRPGHLQARPRPLLPEMPHHRGVRRAERLPVQDLPRGVRAPGPRWRCPVTPPPARGQPSA